MSGTVRKICARCGRMFEAKAGGRPALYCSGACQKAAARARSREAIAPDVAPAPRAVTGDDLAAAVLQARGAERAFEAGRKHGPETLRPMCGRIADGIGRVLDREGL